MIHADTVRAIELDINAEWPSLNTYGPHGTRDPAKVVPNDQQSTSRYLSPDDRDFFRGLRSPRWENRGGAVPLNLIVEALCCDRQTA